MILSANLVCLAATCAMQHVETPTASKQAYGTYSINAWGDTGVYTVSNNSTSERVTRRQRLVLECTLRFDKDRLTKAPYAVTTIKTFLASIDYTQQFTGPGPVDRIETSISWSDPVAPKPNNGTVAIDTMGNGVKEVHPNFDPYWDATKRTTITTYYRDSHKKPTEEDRTEVDHGMQMPLIPDWSKAEWTDAYHGSFNGVNRYYAYFLDEKKNYWLKLKLDWRFAPLPFWVPKPASTKGH